MDCSATVILNEKNNVAYLSLNRPAACNALNQTLIQELNRHLKSLAENSNIRLVVLQAEGNHFCSGADLKEMALAKNLSYEQKLAEAQHLSEMLQRLYQLPQPTIACIQGQVRGGGLGLIACVDITLAANNAQFSFSETKLGLIPAIISPYVVSAIGARAAIAQMFSGEVFEAKEAHRLGLIHKLFPEPELAISRDNLIATLLKNGPIALKEMKALAKTLRQQVTPALQESLIEKLAELQSSPEAKEGILAFLEKRQPSWAYHVS